jgi:L-fuculose-phosphate aldolase
MATPSGLAKGFLEPDDLIVVDRDGRLAAGRPGLKPTSELAMHLEAYRQRPDIGGVVHAHPITTVALSIAGVSLAECVIPEAIVFLGLVPTTPYATPSSDENRQAIGAIIGSHDAIVLQYHGTLTVGRTVTEAYQRLETLEHTAKIVALSRLLGGGPPLPPEQVSKLLAARQALGLERPGDAGAFCVACGVCHAAGEHRPPGSQSGGGERPGWDNRAVDEEERLVREIARRVRQALSP